MTQPLHHLTAREIAAGVRELRWSALAVAKHFLARIKRFDGELRAFVPGGVDPDLTLVHAARIDQALAAGRDPGPLAGVPVALKDNLCLRGLPTTCSSRILEGWRPPYDADAVARLLGAGAVPLGKTNLDEFAMGSSTENSAFGATRNPWDRRRVPGGSSGGSAAAVAAGLAPLALGSDTGGSIRQPAALCGIAGAMGTYGRVSRRGLVAFGSSLDRVGPLARSVGDVALCLRLLSGGDPGDATTLPEAPPDWTASADEAVKGLRLGVLRPDAAAGSGDPESSACFETACARLADAGAASTQVALPTSAHGISVYYLVAPSEASSNLARYDGVRFGLRVPSDDLGRMLAETREQGFGPEVKRRILLGTFALSAGYAEAFYEKALRVRRLIANDYARAFETCDVVVSLTSLSPAFEVGEKADDPLAMYLCDLFTIPASLAGLPALSVPIGRTAAGLPVGLQVVAPAKREDLMFRVAGAVERALGGAPLAEAYR
jgi:aspartyl-tRNA(Asn)/glutamyl-tRNA(Gln) amidotransferase subunit A